MLKPVLAVVAGFAFGVAAFAAEVELRDDHPDTYVVQKGDTLWDIAGRFLKSPWLWPEIWQANPQVENPHRIYPGDRLSLVYIDGRPRLVMGEGRDGKLSPSVRRTPTGDAVGAVPLSQVQPFLERTRVLDEAEVESMPYVVGLEENRLRSTTGQLAYVRGLNAAPGAKVSILRPTYAYYDVPETYPWETSPRTVKVESWSAERGVNFATLWDEYAVHHAYQRHVDYLGHEVVDVGYGEVLRAGDPATVLVEYGDVEIKKGDLVTLAPAEPFDLSFQPRGPGDVPENMRVMAFTDALNAIGPHQVVALNKGARDGVETGEVYAVFQPGQVVDDDVAFADPDFRTAFRPSHDDVQLPEEFVGHVMVFRTFEKVSYGLVMDGIRPVHLYDELRPPVN